MRNHIVVIVLSLPPKTLYQQFINWPVKSGKEVFPTLENHLWPQIQPIRVNGVEVNPQFLQSLKIFGVHVTVNVSGSLCDVIIIHSEGDGFLHRRRRRGGGRGTCAFSSTALLFDELLEILHSIRFLTVHVT